MNIRSIFLTLVASAFLFTASAQNLGYGFKVGLNFATFQGDEDTDANGDSFETFNRSTGFNIGAGVIYRVTDRFGVKLDFLFSQKGTKQSLDGQGVQYFYQTTGDKIPFEGQRNSFLRITNSYIDLPLTGYAKFDKIEFSGGMYVGFLVASKGVGDVTYSGDALLSGDLTGNFEYNYLKDEVPDPTTWAAGNDFSEINIDNTEALYPINVGAYHDFDTNEEDYFSRVDVGLNVGLAYYFNKGLFFSLNLNYGLLDVTNNLYDISYSARDGNGFKKRNDKDNNLTIQANVGFNL